MQRSAFADEADQAASLTAICATIVGMGGTSLLVRPWWDPTHDAAVSVPILYALAVIGAALTVFLLVVRVRIVDNDRLRWMIAGLTIAATAVLFQTVVIADLRRVPEIATPSGAASLYGIWHAALALFALGGALVPARHDLRRALTAVFVLLLWVALFEPSWDLLPTIVGADGRLTGVQLPATLSLTVLTALAAIAWVVSGGRRATRPDVWIALMLAVAVFDLIYGLRAETWLESIWHNGASLRAAQFIVPAAGLLADNARLVGLLHRHERGLDRQLARAAELAERASERPASDAVADRRVRAVIADEDFHPVFQPIVALETGRTLAVEALTRFTAQPHRSPDRWFDEAHAVGRGIELEVATLRAALAAAEGLAAPIAVSVNVSPAALIDARLLACLDEHGHGRPLIVEITEHAPIGDYAILESALTALRERGVRIAIDDAGAGFASLRHVVRLGPDVIKLDMSLTRDVHRDPVRRALAGSLADFSRRTGSMLIAEGVEHTAELEVLRALGVHAAQGYLLCRPVPVDELPTRYRLAPDPVGSRP